jgi:muramoyltetrapeptide carboxypeptidase
MTTVSFPAWQTSSKLRSGDRVAVVAPSGPLQKERFSRGAELLGARYDLVYSPGLLTQQGFLAGPDGRRLSELRWALSEPAVRAVFAARGGHGMLRILPALTEVPATELRPVPFVGFSDLTVMHAFLAQRRHISIHGPVVSQLGDLEPTDLLALWALLEDPAPPPPLEGLAVILPSAGRVDGRLLGGNLEVLSRLCGTPLQGALSPGEPVVLLIEEVSEVPYRIDRALTQLMLAGALRDVRAIVVGDLIRCESPGSDGPAALDVIAERARQLGVAVVAGAPVGHGGRNRPLPIGARVTLTQGRLLFHDGAVI